MILLGLCAHSPPLKENARKTRLVEEIRLLQYPTSPDGPLELLARRDVPRCAREPEKKYAIVLTMMSSLDWPAV